MEYNCPNIIKNNLLEGGIRLKGIVKSHYSEKPLVSIVTVVYNGAEHLEETIMSVNHQTYDNVEHIIIDGSSTDGTLDIIRKYDGSIDYWLSEKDQGIYYAMNKGIKLANGELITLLNSDDFYFNDNVVADIVKAYDFKNKKPDIIYGDMIMKEKEIDYSLYANISNMKYTMSINHPTCFLRKELYINNEFDTQFRICADYDLLLKMYLLNYQFIYLNKPITVMRAGGASASPKLYIEKFQIHYNQIGTMFACVNLIKGLVKRTYVVSRDFMIEKFFGEAFFLNYKRNKVINGRMHA